MRIINLSLAGPENAVLAEAVSKYADRGATLIALPDRHPERQAAIPRSTPRGRRCRDRRRTAAVPPLPHAAAISPMPDLGVGMTVASPGGRRARNRNLVRRSDCVGAFATAKSGARGDKLQTLQTVQGLAKSRCARPRPRLRMGPGSVSQEPRLLNEIAMKMAGDFFRRPVVKLTKLPRRRANFRYQPSEACVFRRIFWRAIASSSVSILTSPSICVLLRRNGITCTSGVPSLDRVDSVLRRCKERKMDMRRVGSVPRCRQRPSNASLGRFKGGTNRQLHPGGVLIVQ